MLTILDTLPDTLLELEAAELYQVLDGPTLIHLPGGHPRPLFVSVLQHGNEQTGWLAVRRLLRAYQGRRLPRALSLFVSNVAAAREGRRHLPEQPDYNRMWRGTGLPEQAMMQQIVAEMRDRDVFASVDIHNNTGLNPHYACINRLDHRFLQCAALFSRTVVYFLRPEGVQSAAFAQLCPAVTLECGRSAEPQGIDHAYSYLEAMLNMAEIPAHPVAAGDVALFHTVAVVKIPQQFSCGFADAGLDFRFVSDLDRLNFSELPPGTRFATLDSGNPAARFDVTDEGGEDVGARYFAYDEGAVTTRVPLMPSMLTLDTSIIRQDCLCYLMERVPYPFVAEDHG